MTEPSMMDHAHQRHINTHGFDLSADGESLIKGVNQQNAKGETVVQLPD